MSVPGSNLLNQALTLIAAQAITYLAFTGRTKNDLNQFVAAYAEPTTIRGSLQPVPRSLMETLGLDMQKNYVNIFVPNALIDIARDVTSDQIQFAGKTYQCLSLTPWFTLDGWNQMLCVEIPNAG